MGLIKEPGWLRGRTLAQHTLGSVLAPQNKTQTKSKKNNKTLMVGVFLPHPSLLKPLPQVSVSLPRMTSRVACGTAYAVDK
jgi:hypothetical protein